MGQKGRKGSEQKRGALARLSPARKDPVYRRFAQEVGHKELLAVLECSDDARGDALSNMLRDPAYQGYSLGKLCELVGLRFADLVRMFQRFYTGIGIIRVSRFIPQVMEDTALNALSRDEPCVDCDGTGKRRGRTCRDCRGKGTVHVLGDLTCLKLVYEVMGLTGRHALKRP